MSDTMPYHGSRSGSASGHPAAPMPASPLEKLSLSIDAVRRLHTKLNALENKMFGIYPESADADGKVDVNLSQLAHANYEEVEAADRRLASILDRL